MSRPIGQSTTIDKSFYLKNTLYELSKESLFCKSWQYIADSELLHKSNHNIFPVRLLEHCLDESLIIVNKEDNLLCLSNICTHRAFELIHEPSKSNKITCGYHGRRFDLNGQVEHMPMFEEVDNFPRACDHLHRLNLHQWKRFLFTSINSSIDFGVIEKQLNHRLLHMDMNQWSYASEYHNSYHIDVHWALYIENYLEGFHIPFVHGDLTSIIDFGNYTTIVDDHMVLQIAYGKSNDPAIDLPERLPDFGKNVTAYYYWIFPNFMLNIYNWGVQINIVKPLGINKCKVDFEYYIADEKLWEEFGKDRIAEITEIEDEEIILSVQKGIKSRFYQSGQYAPKMETGIHYFHELIKQYLDLNSEEVNLESKIKKSKE